MGTAAYMSPEQAKGKTADRCAPFCAPSDIALNLTGPVRAVCRGDSATDIEHPTRDA